MTATDPSTWLNDIPVENIDADETDERAEGGEPAGSFLVSDDFTGPDTGDFVKTPPRSPKAITYEKKVKRGLITWMRFSIRNPNTAPDAAAIIKYGKDVSQAAGDLAAHDKRVAGAIDFLSEGTSNPYLAFFAIAAVMGAQILRNHEPVAESEGKRFRIPFTQRFLRLRFKIKLGRLRDITEEPATFTHGIFADPKVQANLAKYHGVQIVKSDANGRHS
jgi:hypothetical protein